MDYVQLEITSMQHLLQHPPHQGSMSVLHILPCVQAMLHNGTSATMQLIRISNHNHSLLCIDHPIIPHS